MVLMSKSKLKCLGQELRSRIEILEQGNNEETMLESGREIFAKIFKGKKAYRRTEGRKTVKSRVLQSRDLLATSFAAAA